jgi:acyl-CoA synthetase (AMP-forming)/AMP-acid ligase II
MDRFIGVIRAIGAAVLFIAGRSLQAQEKAVSDLIKISGKPVPVADIAATVKAIEEIARGVAAKKSPAEIKAAVLPIVEGVAEDVAQLLFPPFGGTVVELLVLLISRARPATAEDEARLSDRNTGSGAPPGEAARY